MDLIQCQLCKELKIYYKFLFSVFDKMKRIFDVIFSFVGLLLVSPIFLFFMLLIWLQDYHSPFYIAARVGKNGKLFNMIKLRSMVQFADKSGVDSTAVDDKRITQIGHLIRRTKLDEFSQLLNVLMGQMSLVGPRPNVQQGVDLYTKEESRLLDVRPGITDLASIVFSDEGDILEGADDPDLRYNQIIRPWKSRLGLFYVKRQSFIGDITLVCLTIVAIFSRSMALKGIKKMLTILGADQQLISVSLRNSELCPYPPPGADTIVESKI